MTMAPSTAHAATDKDRSREYFAEAKEYLAGGNVKAAVIQLKNALQNDPKNVAARKLLGQIYIRIGKGPAAEKEIRAAIRLGGNRRALSPLLGRALLLQGRYDDALSAAVDDLGQGSQRARILIIRGQAFLGLHRFDDSAAAFREADRLNPEDVRAKVGLAQGLVNQRRVNEAEREVDIALSRRPKSAEARALKGELRRLRRDLKGAVAQFDKALAINGNNILARLGRAASLIDLNREDEAVADINAVFRRVPRHPLASYLSALVLAKKKDWAGVQETLQGVGRALDNHMPSVFLSGAVHYAQNQLEQAVRKLERYVDAVPRNRRARKLLAAALLRTRAAGRSIEILKPLKDKIGDDVQLLVLLGSAHMQIGKFNKGTEYFGRAAAISPDVADIRTKLALGNLASGQADTAVGELERALSIDPDARQAAVLLALVKLRRGDYDGALATARELRAKMPDNPLPDNLIGAAYLGKGDTEMARKTFSATLARKPGFHAARMNLGQLDLREGKIGDARKQFETILEYDDKHMGAMLALADIAARRRDAAGTVSWLTKATDAHPKAVGPRLRLIRHYRSQREFRKALSVSRELDRNVPNNARVLEAMGRAETSARQALSAVSTFRRLISLTPKSARNMGLLAAAQIAARDTQGARDTLKLAIALDARYLPVRIALVELEARAGNFVEATALARELRKLRPNDAVGDLLMGDIHLRRQQFDRAIAAYDAGLAKSDTSSLAIRRYNARRKAGRTTEALEELQRWTDRKDDRTARHVLATGYITNGAHDLAIRESEKLLKKEPKNPVILNNLAWLYQQKGDSRAAVFAERALAQAPRSAAVLDTLGWILVEEGNMPRALDLLRKANTLAPEMGDIQYHMAVALHKSGRSREARRELKRLLDSDRQFSMKREAHDLLKRLAGG
jgi:putative PEP-CTERM system TPR-repeat lipoprotein